MQVDAIRLTNRAQLGHVVVRAAARGAECAARVKWQQAVAEVFLDRPTQRLASQRIVLVVVERPNLHQRNGGRLFHARVSHFRCVGH